MLRIRRTIEKLTQTRDKFAEQGADTTAMDAQIDKLQEQQEPQLDALARRHRMAREKLDEIMNEGDSNGWGNP